MHKQAACGRYSDETVYVAVTVGAVTEIMDVTVDATGVTEMVVGTVDR
jgi:hypothetical protein